MRVVAIKDAPIVDAKLSAWTKKSGLTQAYKIGDIFELSKEHQLLTDHLHGTYMVIFNHHTGSYMEVNYENFISLDEYRENQINELLST